MFDGHRVRCRGGGAGQRPEVRMRPLCGLLALALPIGIASGAMAAGSAASSTVTRGQQITVSIPIAAPTSAPVYLASALGYFKKEGLDVNIQLVPFGYESLAAGQIQYGLISTSQVVAAAAGGTGLQMICVAQTDPSYVLAVNQKTLTTAGITRSTSLKKALTKLHGQEVTELGGAVNPGSVLLAALLKRNGLPTNWITVVSETSNASATAAFLAGQVNVVFQPQPVPDQLLEKVPGRILFDTGDSKLFSSLTGTPWSGIAASATYLAAHPSQSKKVCSAIGKADDYMVKHPAQAAKLLQPQMTSYSVKLIERALPTYHWAADGTMSQAKFDAGVKILASYGVLSQPTASVLQAAYSTTYQSDNGKKSR